MPNNLSLLHAMDIQELCTFILHSEAVEICVVVTDFDQYFTTFIHMFSTIGNDPSSLLTVLFVAA